MSKKEDPLPGKQLLDKAKETEKQRKKEMKKPLIEAIKTWTIVTLVGLILMTATFFVAFNKGIESERGRLEQIKREAKALTATATTVSK